ncbi:MAG: 3-dehydroquinate synthase [Deltaproteobacteria bacterium]|nr:3-dehydroquinate synthase [Deltaproteobacteria bacterium]
MAELKVGLGERSYPIYVEQGFINLVGRDLSEKMVGNKYGVIADDNVARLYGAALLNVLADAGIEATLFTFPEGEKNKTLQTVGDLASRLAQGGYDRHDALIALGGGVTGDITGFLASSYMRGIPYVQIPTTLLAQVDSSVGGKTGVDIPEGKNLVGAFYQPKAVYIDIELLKTLPGDELLGGLGEVIKYGVIRDPEFFDFLQKKRSEILALDMQLLEKMIYRCCEIKAGVVAEDEREGGVRKILNYGHTIGHAVEAASDFTLIHGLAVSIGMVAAARLAVANDLLTADVSEKIYQLLKLYKMPVEVPDNLDRKRIKKYLLTDKKAVSGKVVFVLPVEIGDTRIVDTVTEEQIDKVLA